MQSNTFSDQQRLKDHFDSVFNVARPYLADLLDNLSAFDSGLTAEHWSPPSFDEFLNTRKELASNKAPDSSGVHAELLKILDMSVPVEAEILRQLHNLVVRFWQGHLTSADIQLWHFSTMFMIYKGRGDRKDLDNWRGVVLLDIVSKLVSRMLNSRLLVLADRLCHDMEVGYWKQRGVSDGIFVLRRLLMEEYHAG